MYSNISSLDGARREMRRSEQMWNWCGYVSGLVLQLHQSCSSFSSQSLFQSLSHVCSTRSHSLRPSLEFAEEVEQSAVELAGFVHVTGVSCSCQLHHGVMRQLNQVLMGLGAQIGV